MSHISQAIFVLNPLQKYTFFLNCANILAIFFILLRNFVFFAVKIRGAVVCFLLWFLGFFVHICIKNDDLLYDLWLHSRKFGQANRDYDKKSQHRMQAE